MKRIEDEVRDAIAELALAIEEEGWEVNRRALAREFDVSPQTVARILDGPKARRGVSADMKEDGSGIGWIIAGVGAVVAAAWWLFRNSTE